MGAAHIGVRCCYGYGPAVIGMNIFYTDVYPLPLPIGHRFPIEKYSLLRRRLTDSGRIAPQQLRLPEAARRRDILRAHCPHYYQRFLEGALDARTMRRIGFPWSPELVERTLRSAGATLQAGRLALQEGVAVCLSGGTHHAHYDRGEGYCILNDSAIAARTLLAEKRVQRVLILDCDVHQGNGTASILAGQEGVFTFSIHGAKNFPFRKAASDLDIALADGTTDTAYLAALQPALETVFLQWRPELVIYLAGADPLCDDRFGRMALTRRGLAARDRMVFNYCRDSGAAVAVTMAGGYGRRIEETVAVHAQTVAAADALFRHISVHPRRGDGTVECPIQK